VVQFLKSTEYSKFKRIVFDTAPTGHTLRLLTLPDFLELTIGKLVKLRQKLDGALDLVRGVFGRTKTTQAQSAVEKLERLKADMEEAKRLFRDSEKTEFAIVTIPTMMAALESERLADTLLKESIPAKTLLVNQVVLRSTKGTFLQQKRKEQQRALSVVKSDPVFEGIRIETAPLVDLEIRGIPALTYFASQIWK